MNLKCETCKNPTKVKWGWYCKYFKHRFEHGFAMKWHSKNCKGYDKIKK